MNKDVDIQSLKDKIDNLNQQAWNVRVYDSPKSFELSHESLGLARNINYAKGIANAAQLLGFCYVRLSKNKEALPLLNESLSLFKSLNDLKGQAVIYQYQAIVHRNQGNFGVALELLFKALAINQRNGFREDESTDYYQIGVTYKYLGNFEKALDTLFISLSIQREMNNRLFQSYSINVIGSIYFEDGNYTRALEFFQEGLSIRQESNDKLGESGSLDNIGFAYLKLKDYPKAIEYCKQSLAISKGTGDNRSQGNALLHLAEIFKETGDTKQAANCCDESLLLKRLAGDKRGEAETLLFLADLHREQVENKEGSGIIDWLLEAASIAEEITAIDILSKARFGLYGYYKQAGKYIEAIEQLELHIRLESEVHRNTINQKMANIEISHKAEETKKEAEAIKIKNEELTKLNKTIEEQKEKLEQTLEELKATQSQLIQSEKMASLGELTAGIAHEIQNPLNFVNNFSEVSIELIAEMNTELEKCEIIEAKAIAYDVKQNLEKIRHHGQRAADIVKGMLLHSRSSSDVKEPTDINALGDEYLRLAYNGLRANVKSFNVTMHTDFDESIGKVNLVSRDIGRVILNLVNNAFYAVAEKMMMPGVSVDNYIPGVWLSTKKLDGKIEIRVKDNGNGIQQKIIDKIFQPFFTTKPTGSGTGLGLSLSYDIITKGHGGELKVATREGEFTEFVMRLPV